MGKLFRGVVKPIEVLTLSELLDRGEYVQLEVIKALADTLYHFFERFHLHCALFRVSLEDWQAVPELTAVAGRLRRFFH